jgi:hypothetical protein
MKEGKMSMNFGPLNVMVAKWLKNVAVTRARYEMHISLHCKQTK